MSLVFFLPHEKIPFKDLFYAAVAALVIPAALGAAMLGVFNVAGNVFSEEFALSLWIGGTVLLLSPFLAVSGMILAVPVASYLIRLGWFGWIPAGLVGLAIGTLLPGMLEYNLAAPFGLASLLILRAVLGRLRPMVA
ncbi:hypothetical protein ACSBLW_01160 [Thioclava sp. FR2]|uniref:hypothetical protein n=1 Tax=Thioclava sp. FR2 TaxID=3445780 RepID=UPI003EBEBCC4